MTRLSDSFALLAEAVGCPPLAHAGVTMMHVTITWIALLGMLSGGLAGPFWGTDVGAAPAPTPRPSGAEARRTV